MFGKLGCNIFLFSLFLDLYFILFLIIIEPPIPKTSSRSPPKYFSKTKRKNIHIVYFRKSKSSLFTIKRYKLWTVTIYLNHNIIYMMNSQSPMGQTLPTYLLHPLNTKNSQMIFFGIIIFLSIP